MFDYPTVERERLCSSTEVSRPIRDGRNSSLHMDLYRSMTLHLREDVGILCKLLKVDLVQRIVNNEVKSIVLDGSLLLNRHPTMMCLARNSVCADAFTGKQPRSNSLVFTGKSGRHYFHISQNCWTVTDTHTHTHTHTNTPKKHTHKKTGNARR